MDDPPAVELAIAKVEDHDVGAGQVSEEETFITVASQLRPEAGRLGEARGRRAACLPGPR